jgi:DNA-binding MarR family transcriptional regulator
MAGSLYWLKRAYFAGKKAFDEALAEHGLTATQLELLRRVWQQDGVEQRVLQEDMGVSSPTLTGVVDRLVLHGLLERRPSPADARVKTLHLTEAGLAISDRLDAINAQAEARLLHGFSTAEVALLQQWLERMARNSDLNDDCP